MATTWPANIDPGAAVVLYGGVSITQKVTYVRLLGPSYQGAIPTNYTSPSLPAMSRCYANVSFYDGSTTRDIMDAGKTGRGAMSVMTGTGSPGSEVSTPNGDVIFVGGPSVLTPVPDQIASMQQQDDNFTHTAAHQIVRAYTEVRYYDGPLVNGEPSGNLLASYPIVEWKGDGSTIPQLLGSPYPTIDPKDNNTDVE